MSCAKIQAVTFDAAHTLFHPHPSVGAIYQEVMRRHGLEYEETALEAGFRQAFASVSKDQAILDGERREFSYWQSIVRESIAALHPQPRDFPALFQDLWETFSHGERWRPAAHAKTTLDALRQRGYRAALLTNWDQRVRRVVAETGFSQRFEQLFISSEIGAEKPDPKIFQHAQNALGLAPEEILHVGDSLQHDIQGARAAGWKAARIGEPFEPDAPDYPRLNDLRQLLDLLP